MILRRSLKCHYCSQKSGRKYDGKIRRWTCNNCEAINYLDAEGNIADPPATSTPKQSSRQYGRQVRRTTSPDLSPQENNIFCATCLQNQHLYQQMLANYEPKSNEDTERYKKELDERYPQVCKDCGVRVNERLQATAYAARADNMRRGMAKRRPFTIDPRIWGWRRSLVAVGGTLWWSSLLGQVIWHVLGILPAAAEQMELRNNTWRDRGLCTMNALMFREIQYSCLGAMRDVAWLTLWAGIASFWWNTKLSAKLSKQQRRLAGLESYIFLQILSLTIRAVTLYAFERPDWIPTRVVAMGIHGGMLLFLSFTTLVSLTTVRLMPPRKPNLEEYRPIDIGTLKDPIRRLHHTPVDVQSNTAMRFPVSSLAQPAQQAPLAPHELQFAPVEHDDNEMDWTPTGPSEITHISPQHPPEYRRPEGPNPFRGILPPAPVPPAHRIRNPRQFIPASQERKNSFMKEIRGEIRAATGSPDDEDDIFSFGGRKNGGLNMMLGQPSLRDFQSEKAETGLENLFNAAFSIKDQPIEIWRREEKEKRREEKGYILDGETVRENVMIIRAIVAVSAFLVILLAVAIGMGWINVKGFIEGMLYKGGPVREIHQVVEEMEEAFA